MDIGYIKSILTHAAAVHGTVVSVEPVDLARVALGRLGLVGKGDERDRRPTQNELDRIIAAFQENKWQQIPVDKIVRFAVATAMRQDEINGGLHEDEFKKVLRRLIAIFRDTLDPAIGVDDDPSIFVADVIERGGFNAGTVGKLAYAEAGIG